MGTKDGAHDVSSDVTPPALCHPSGEAVLSSGAVINLNLLEGISIMLCFRISTAEY